MDRIRCARLGGVGSRRTSCGTRTRLNSPARASRSRSSPIFSRLPLGSPRCGSADSCDSSRGGRTVIVRRSERRPEPRRRVLVPARRTEVPAVVVDVTGRASQGFHREPGRRDVVRALVAINAAARCAAEHRHPRCPPMPRLESRIAVAHMRQRESAVSPAAVAIRSAVSSTVIATSGRCSRAMQVRYPAQKLENQQPVGTLRAIHGTYARGRERSRVALASVVAERAREWHAGAAEALAVSWIRRTPAVVGFRRFAGG